MSHQKYRIIIDKATYNQPHTLHDHHLTNVSYVNMLLYSHIAPMRHLDYTQQFSHGQKRSIILEMNKQLSHRLPGHVTIRSICNLTLRAARWRDFRERFNFIVRNFNNRALCCRGIRRIEVDVSSELDQLFIILGDRFWKRCDRVDKDRFYDNSDGLFSSERGYADDVDIGNFIGQNNQIIFRIFELRG